jgi:hypothetical protein
MIAKERRAMQRVRSKKTMEDYLDSARIEIDKARRENFRLRRLVEKKSLDATLYLGLSILLFFGLLATCVLVIIGGP